MLTKEQIDRYRIYDCGREEGDVYSKCDCPLLRKILDQATQAIDLAAENERLKAKLDAVRAECVKTIEFNGEVGEASEARYILAIIDKDGDEK